jgi:hypothetical protein
LPAGLLPRLEDLRFEILVDVADFLLQDLVELPFDLLDHTRGFFENVTILGHGASP